MNGKIFQVDAGGFEQEVMKSGTPVLVYFYSEDCAPCTAVAPMLERLVEAFAEKVKFVKVFRQQNRQLAESYNIKSSPTVMFFKEGKEVCPRLNGYISTPELKAAIESVLGDKCAAKKVQKVYCDVLILGGGPAGMSAAIYAARAKLFTVLVDEGLTGGQVATTFHVANYPGTNGVVRGMDLMENMKKQALDFGTRIDDMKEILEVCLSGDEKYVKTEDAEYFAKAIILATGAQPRKLPAEGEREFRGRGVHYCATCDGALYQDAKVIVVGGGESALEEAVFLTRYAKTVVIVNRSDKFRASKAAIDEVMNNQAISVMWNSEIRKIYGENFVTSAEIEDTKTREMKELEVDGVFVYIGTIPRTDLFKDQLPLNESGYIKTDEDMAASIPGVYAAGDVRVKKIRQISTAVSDGTIAGIMAERYINNKG